MASCCKGPRGVTGGPCTHCHKMPHLSIPQSGCDHIRGSGTMGEARRRALNRESTLVRCTRIQVSISVFPKDFARNQKQVALFPEITQGEGAVAEPLGTCMHMRHSHLCPSAAAQQELPSRSLQGSVWKLALKSHQQTAKGQGRQRDNTIQNTKSQELENMGGRERCRAQNKKLQVQGQLPIRGRLGQPKRHQDLEYPL